MRTSLIFALILVFSSFMISQNFLIAQKEFVRVGIAFDEKESVLIERLNAAGLTKDNFHLLFVAYKDEDELELYVKRKDESVYKRLVTYPVCNKSGVLGPKRKRGDLQVPEGFYLIDRFNPVSTYYLSLGINYPNKSDRKKSTASDPGGDIFIHGSCVTIGCLPMTDDRIKEIYLYAVHARNNGQVDIPVYIFPFRMNEINMRKFNEQYKHDKALMEFWKNLKTGYDKFQTKSTALKASVDDKGNYNFD